MSIWRYDAESRLPSYGAFFTQHCIFCGTGLDLFSDRSGTLDRITEEAARWRSADHGYGPSELTYTLCPLCGWWTFLRSDEMESRRGKMSVQSGAVGALKNIDKTDISVPLSEVQQYLIACLEARRTINWRLFEETVAAVFRSLGYEARVTSRSNDGGLDIILTDGSGDVVGVQVKRYEKKIVADQIRALLGALVQEGMTKGIFVTTSSYQPKAHYEADAAHSKGYLIELVDGDSLYDTMGIVRLDAPEAELFANLPKTPRTRRLWRSPVA